MREISCLSNVRVASMDLFWLPFPWNIFLSSHCWDINNQKTELSGILTEGGKGNICEKVGIFSSLYRLASTGKARNQLMHPEILGGWLVGS